MISNTPSRPSASRGLDGFGVARLQHDLDVELAERIIELAQRVGEDRQHLGLAEHRHQHGEYRQFVFAQRPRLDRDRLVGHRPSDRRRPKPGSP